MPIAEPIAVGFDLDATLLNSYPVGFGQLERLAIQFGLPYSDRVRTLIAEHWGKPGRELIAICFGIDEARAKTIYDVWEELTLNEPSRMIRGAHSTLQSLHKDGHVLSLLTSRTRLTLDPFLARNHRLRRRLLHVVARDDVEHPKPDPRALACTQRFWDARGIPQGRRWFVGDSDVDILVGQDAGLLTIGVETGPSRQLDRVTPTLRLRSVAQIPEALEAFYT